MDVKPIQYLIVLFVPLINYGSLFRMDLNGAKAILNKIKASDVNLLNSEDSQNVLRAFFYRIVSEILDNSLK